MVIDPTGLTTMLDDDLKSSIPFDLGGIKSSPTVSNRQDPNGLRLDLVDHAVIAINQLTAVRSEWEQFQLVR